MSSNPREITIETLKRDPENPGFVEILLNNKLDQCNLSRKDRALARELTLGVTRWRLTLEWLAGRKLHAQPPEVVLSLISMGLYQLFWMDRIPAHAAVFETVELCNRVGAEKFKTLVNAILRGYVREMDKTRELLKELRQRDPALACSHPDWLYSRWEKKLGSEETLKLMDWDNSIPQPILRTNTLRVGSREELLEQLLAEPMEAQAVDFPFLDEQLMIKLARFEVPHHSPRYDAGLFYVQDPATLVSVQMLDPRPGERVLDNCAAPGGKTTYIAQRMKNQGEIVAVDIAERLHLIEENCKRLGINIVKTLPIRELRAVKPEAEYDRILLDVPCSNTGVLRRRVEARYRLSLKELEVLKTTQATLLNEAAPRLKAGGTLVYSTCSIDSEENEEQIESFLKSHPDFHLKAKKLLLPYQTQTDGAFVAALERDKK